MTLKLGEWAINSNGTEGILRIISVNEAGTINGGFRNNPIVGGWNETSKTINFVSIKNGLMARFYEGYLFSTPMVPEADSDIHWTLAGRFYVADLTDQRENGGNTKRNMFGWVAQITEVV